MSDSWSDFCIPITGSVNMGESGSRTGLGASKDILKQKMDLSEYTITQIFNDSGEQIPRPFKVNDGTTKSEIHFTGVEIIRTATQTINFTKLENGIMDVIDQDGINWDGNSRAKLVDVEPDEALDLGAGLDVFHFIDQQNVEGSVDLGNNSVEDRVVLRESFKDYSFTFGDESTVKIYISNYGSTITFCNVGAEDVFVFKNIYYKNGVKISKKNDTFKLLELLEAHDFFDQSSYWLAQYEQDGIKHLGEETFKQVKALALLEFGSHGDNLDIALA